MLVAFDQAPQSGGAQQKPESTISGVVLDGTTGKPIAGAQVMAGAPGGSRRAISPPAVTADGQGRFTFRSMAGGSYRVSATAPGYVPGAAGASMAAPSVPSDDLQVPAGEQRTGVIVRLWMGAIISGTVRTATGHPLVRGSVSAQRVMNSCGTDRLLSGAPVMTDDRGAFRFADLMPGRYVVTLRGAAVSTVRAAYDNSTPSSRLPTLYSPGTPVPDLSRAIDVSAGDERSNVDITLPAKSFRVIGRLVEADGTPSQRRVDLLPATGVTVSQPVSRTFAEQDGRFEFSVVPPGRYVVRTVDFPDAPRGAVMQFGFGFSMSSTDPVTGRPPLVEAPTYWAETPVDVIDADANVTMTLGEGARIRGRVAFNMNGAPPAPETRSMMPVIVMSATATLDESFQAARIEPDGSFRTVALPSGQFGMMIFAAAGGPRTTLESIRTGGRDVAGSTVTLTGADISDVVITVTDKGPYVTGTVLGGADLVTFGAQVVVFPVEDRTWFTCGPFPSRIATAVAGSDGTFRTWAVPPGEYFVSSLVGGEQDPFDPAFLRTLVPYATRVKLALGDHPSVALKPRPRR